jgi:hypothetical protein
MKNPVQIPLCEYHDELGRHELFAVLDELSLTYRVAVRHPDGRIYALRQFIPSRRNARRWAEHYRLRQLRTGSSAAVDRSPAVSAERASRR